MISAKKWKERDPLKEFSTYQYTIHEWERGYPVCSECGDYITDDYYYEVRGETYCCDCIERMKKWNDEV